MRNIYIYIYSTRCLRFPIPFVEDNGERTNADGPGEQVTTPQFDKFPSLFSPRKPEYRDQN